MSDLWDDLRVLLRRQDYASEFTTDEKIDLLVQMVANLIDEVEILKQLAWKQSGLSHAEWLESYRKDKMWFLFSSAGPIGACVSKYMAYLKNRTETAEKLIPDQAKREEAIRELSCLT
jgi:hypothetical protein